ncbi:MAG: hypothetical protein QM581_07360 [Pseudomonas sp.]
MSTLLRRLSCAVALICLVMTLSGCQRDEISLDVGESVTDSQGELSGEQEVAITDALNGLGLQDFKLSPDEERRIDTGSGIEITRSRVLVRFKRPLTLAQRAQLRRQLDGLLAQRAAFDDRVTLDVEDDDRQEPGAAAAAWRIQRKLKFSGSQLPILKQVSGGPGEVNVYEVGCAASFKLDEDISADELAGLPSGRSIRISFADPTLQAMQHEERMQLRTSQGFTRLEFDDSERISLQFLFDFGAAGRATQVTSIAFVTPLQERDCERTIAQAGHPFDFFIGSGLNRLVGVEYRFTEQAK